MRMTPALVMSVSWETVMWFAELKNAKSKVQRIQESKSKEESRISCI